LRTLFVQKADDRGMTRLQQAIEYEHCMMKIMIENALYNQEDKIKANQPIQVNSVFRDRRPVVTVTDAPKPGMLPRFSTMVSAFHPLPIPSANTKLTAENKESSPEGKSVSFYRKRG